MQYKDIELFLELVNSRNITKASEHLFMAQSVISTRLKKLEEELGYDLFIRNKGMREIELTGQGSSFVSIAIRLQSLYEDAALLKESTRKVLRVAAPESIYFDFLQPVIFNIVRKYPDINITAEMIDSSGVYEMMDSSRIDFGFASYESAHHNIKHQHFYDQSFCLITSGNYKGPVDPKDLDPSNEIIFTGGNFSSIDLWREECLSSKSSSRIQVNSSMMIVNYLKEFDSWALLPREDAEMLAELFGLSTVELTRAPESRKIYFLTHTSSSMVSTEAADIFLKELNDFVKIKQKEGLL